MAQPSAALLQLKLRNAGEIYPALPGNDSPGLPAQTCQGPASINEVVPYQNYAVGGERERELAAGQSPLQNADDCADNENTRSTISIFAYKSAAQLALENLLEHV